MGLITRILFGKKKAKPIEARPIETRPIETKPIETMKKDDELNEYEKYMHTLYTDNKKFLAIFIAIISIL